MIPAMPAAMAFWPEATGSSPAKLACVDAFRTRSFKGTHSEHEAMLVEKRLTSLHWWHRTFQRLEKELRRTTDAAD